MRHSWTLTCCVKAQFFHLYFIDIPPHRDCLDIPPYACAGPVLVSADEITDPQNLRLVTRVNGEIMQDSTSKDMVCSVAKLISFLSQVRGDEPRSADTVTCKIKEISNFPTCFSNRFPILFTTSRPFTAVVVVVSFILQVAVGLIKYDSLQALVKQVHDAPQACFSQGVFMRLLVLYANRTR